MTKRYIVNGNLPVTFQIEKLKISVNTYKSRLFPTTENPRFHQPKYEVNAIHNVVSGIEFNINEIANDYRQFLIEKYKNSSSTTLINITQDELFSFLTQPVTNAEIYRQLKEKLERLEAATQTTSNSADDQSKNTNVRQKLKWLGTPSEFGYIMSELIDKGYIERLSKIGDTQTTLLTIFEVTSDKGVPIKVKTLNDYMSRLKKGYPKGKFNIPKSENYNLDS